MLSNIGDINAWLLSQKHTVKPFKELQKLCKRREKGKNRGMENALVQIRCEKIVPALVFVTFA